MRWEPRRRRNSSPMRASTPANTRPRCHWRKPRHGAGCLARQVAKPDHDGALLVRIMAPRIYDAIPPATICFITHVLLLQDMYMCTFIWVFICMLVCIPFGNISFGLSSVIYVYADAYVCIYAASSNRVKKLSAAPIAATTFECNGSGRPNIAENQACTSSLPKYCGASTNAAQPNPEQQFNREVELLPVGPYNKQPATGLAKRASYTTHTTRSSKC